jgi:hypothetical protein
MWSLVIAGAAIALVSLYVTALSQARCRVSFLCLMVMASSLIAIPIPRVSGRITVADTFVFLTMLLYGGSCGDSCVSARRRRRDADHQQTSTNDSFQLSDPCNVDIFYVAQF